METNSDRRKRKLAELCSSEQYGGLNGVAAAADLNPATLDQILKGVLGEPRKDGTRIPRALGDRATRAIEVGLELGRGWFDQEVVIESPPRGGKHSRGNVSIEQFDTGGSMGRGVVLRDQPGVIQSWHVSPEWIQKNVRGYSSAQNLCIVTGFGDSMRPMYNPGDPLLVDIGVRSVEFDAIYFFRVNDEGFIKRLQRIPGEGVVAISENKAYREWTIKDDMQFEVYGRVLKVWRGEDF